MQEQNLQLHAQSWNSKRVNRLALHIVLWTHVPIQGRKDMFKFVHGCASVLHPKAPMTTTFLQSEFKGEIPSMQQSGQLVRLDLLWKS